MKSILNKIGYTLIHKSIFEQWLLQEFDKRKYKIFDETNRLIDLEIDGEFQELYVKCKAFTMTTPERLYSLYKSVEYIVKNHIPGDFVECGVWRGGSMMMTALTLLKMGVTDRELYLYDTYEGIPEPSNIDISTSGSMAQKMWLDFRNRNEAWCSASLADVKKNLADTGFPLNKCHFVKGKVEDTIPDYIIPTEISLLRLDTDWYESSFHELFHLYPILTHGGVLILDDYGFWKGQQRATDEYFAEIKADILFHRVDHACRLVIKP